MFSVHLNATVCLSSCAFVFGLKKNQILGKVLLLMLLILYYLFYEDLKYSVVFKA